MDEEKKEALRDVVNTVLEGLPVSPEDTARIRGGATEGLVSMLTDHFEGEMGAEQLEALINPDPEEEAAKEVLARKACLRAYPKVKAALKGTVRMLSPPTQSYAMRMWLCMPRGMPKRGVSLSYVSLIERGYGKGPGSKMVETALIGPDSQILYDSAVFGYYDVMEHPSLDECIDHIKDLRQYYVLLSQGEEEAAKALSEEGERRHEERRTAKYESREAERERRERERVEAEAKKADAAARNKQKILEKRRRKQQKKTDHAIRKAWENA
ncbi:hypothetical protein KIPB_006244 [Kipferlia bialata]|uniref:Uncharacterized protein n=1 Tax=Kipferlia bialata TaxID=797122 RepID=A0A9K3CVX2_9EUKA|nr:hypothetical protein KIPB_005740 [Kipferlia bialata]GIQ84696.1 hypothetical protein KIPB_006244 [Kipferlia bialata]|eukprot:g5740.t1